MNFIPVNMPLFDSNEEEYLLDCIRTGWVSSEGAYVSQFEANFATKLGRKYAIAVSSGTAALDIAVAALNVRQGDEVILPTFTIISCINQIIRSGAIPVLIDSDRDTWNMDVSQIEVKITSKTKAIMVVHIYGFPVEMDAVIALAEKYGLSVIEDAAQMLGQTYQGKPCGSFGDLSTFSFYPNKHITTGEGGMIVTDDEVLYDRCRSLRNLCFQAEQRFVHEELGWNYRMTNLQAALGVAQLECLPKHIAKKRVMGHFYDSQLAELPLIQRPIPKTRYAENIYWVYGLVLHEDVTFDARQAMYRLAALGIGTRPFFWPMHEQPVLIKRGLFKGEKYPVAEKLARRGFYIPSGLGINEQQQITVVNALRSVFDG